MALRLFQYWHSESPPADVVQWTRGFRDNNPQFEHVLFSASSARSFISSHLGCRYAEAFDACAVPAMQADYIRLCAIYVCGGVYVDADSQSVAPLQSMISDAAGGMMFTNQAVVSNCFLYFPEKENVFIKECLELATRNIEARRLTVYTATGPGVINAVRLMLDPLSVAGVMEALGNMITRPWGFEDLLRHARASVIVSPELSAAYGAIKLISWHDALPWIGVDQPAYKATGTHWLNWSGPIYR